MGELRGAAGGCPLLSSAMRRAVLGAGVRRAGVREPGGGGGAGSGLWSLEGV